MQLLIDKINTDLLKSIKLENFKAGDVQHSYEVLSVLLGVQGLVDLDHHPVEHLLVNGLGQSSDGVVDLVHPLALGDVLIPYLE